jgi:thioredoxin-related protein
MTRFLGIFCMLLITFSLSAQEAYKAHNEGWMVDLNQAYEESKKTGKPIMANFTGSDWCGWCVKLTNDVFSKPEFKDWAKKNVVLLELDFPRRKQLPENIRQQNSSLQQTFRVTGYPTVWVFTVDKPKGSSEFQVNPIGKTGYTNNAKTFTDTVDQMITQAKGK